MTATTALSALQGALAAEDAAIFGYGAAGAHLTGSSLAAAEQDWTGHHEARDALAAMISRRGATPAAAQAFYQLPFRVHDASSAKALAAHLEDGVTSAYLGLVAVSDQGLRRFGALAMQAAARRAASWRGGTLAFPGLNLLAGAGASPAGACREPCIELAGLWPLLGLIGLPGLVRPDLAMAGDGWASHRHRNGAAMAPQWRRNGAAMASWTRRQPARCDSEPVITGSM
jgi:Domain of unknown function (DUF4439)